MDQVKVERRTRKQTVGYHAQYIGRRNKVGSRIHNPFVPANPKGRRDVLEVCFSFSIKTGRHIPDPLHGVGRDPRFIDGFHHCVDGCARPDRLSPR